MTAAEMEAIIGGYHGDAFSVLGPHPINAESRWHSRHWEIRAFLPQARSASVLMTASRIPMKRCIRRLLRRAAGSAISNRTASRSNTGMAARP